MKRPVGLEITWDIIFSVSAVEVSNFHLPFIFFNTFCLFVIFVVFFLIFFLIFYCLNSMSKAHITIQLRIRTMNQNSVKVWNQVSCQHNTCYLKPSYIKNIDFIVRFSPKSNKHQVARKSSSLCDSFKSIHRSICLTMASYVTDTRLGQQPRALGFTQYYELGTRQFRTRLMHRNTPPLSRLTYFCIL